MKGNNAKNKISTHHNNISSSSSSSSSRGGDNKRIDPLASRLISGMHSLREKELRVELRRIELAKRCYELEHKQEQQKLINRFKSQLQRSNSNLEAIYYSTYHRRVSCEPLAKNTRALFALYELSLTKLDEEEEEQTTEQQQETNSSNETNTKRIKFNLVDKQTQTKKSDLMFIGGGVRVGGGGGGGAKQSEPLRLRSQYLNKRGNYNQKKLMTKLFDIQTQINQESTKSFVESICKKDSGFVLYENSNGYDYYCSSNNNKNLRARNRLFAEAANDYNNHQDENSLADSFSSSLMLIEKRMRSKKRAAITNSQLATPLPPMSHQPHAQCSSNKYDTFSCAEHANDKQHCIDAFKAQYVRSLTFIPPL
jgi:hypothetical protein